MEFNTFKDKIEDIENDYLLKVQKKLAYYEDLVEQGRLMSCHVRSEI
jgi:hypothetical protein